MDGGLDWGRTGGGGGGGDGGTYMYYVWKGSGPVHTMPNKFENATLLLRIRLPSTLIRLYPHKKIHENGTF